MLTIFIKVMKGQLGTERGQAVPLLPLCWLKNYEWFHVVPIPQFLGCWLFFSLPSASLAFTLLGKSPISQMQLAGRNGTGPSIARIGAREAENGSKESATCAWFTSSSATYVLILCWFISIAVRDLPCTFYPVHLSVFFPHIFCCKLQFMSLFRGRKKQQHPFCTPHKGIDWNIGASRSIPGFSNLARRAGGAGDHRGHVVGLHDVHNELVLVNQWAVELKPLENHWGNSYVIMWDKIDFKTTGV